jgi:hypothetical protein
LFVTHTKIAAAFIAIALTTIQAQAQDVASYAIDTTVKLTSDLRTRGTSDSNNKPAARVTVEAAHESGLIALAEFSSVSTKQFPGKYGLGVLAAGGYRFGDPDAWHFGAGLGREFFPGSKFVAPHDFDFGAGEPTNFRSGDYNSTFAILEVNYGALEGRVVDVISNRYRGADTGSVCGTMLGLMADPTKALECYARGDHGSRGTLLFDLDYKYPLNGTTSLILHGGYQKVRNFKEADLRDLRVGITHSAWGFEWSADWVGTWDPVRELYLVPDGSGFRATDNNKVIASVSRKF